MRRTDLKGMTRSEKLDHLAIQGEHPDACWAWQGTCDPQGYATFWDPVTQRTKRAHRLSYEERVGPIPEGLIIRHRCDNPPCTNPRHLEPGTHADNTRDMLERGRGSHLGQRGEAHRKAVLSEREVLTILALRSEGRTYGELCALYPQVHYQTIAAICQRKSWKHLSS